MQGKAQFCEGMFVQVALARHVAAAPKSGTGNKAHARVGLPPAGPSAAGACMHACMFSCTCMYARECVCECVCVLLCWVLCAYLCTCMHAWFVAASAVSF